MAQSSEQVLKAAKTILLIDWPDQSIPRSLVKAGLEVYGFSPGGYSNATIEDDRLIFTKMEDTPRHVDIVFIYRPEAEHERIFKSHLLPLGAKSIWLQPPVTASAIGRLAAEHGIRIIEGISIADIASKI